MPSERRAFRIRRGQHPECWEWECSLCQPPAHGARFGPQAWERIVKTSLPSHLDHRRCHHAYVQRRYREASDAQ